MYEAHFNFSEAPFRLSPDPAFYFGSKGHNRALAYLRYGLTQKEGFIVVTGPPGTGKTTIARALLQEVERDKIIVAELNTTHLQADDVLRMAAASFGLEHEGLAKSTLLKRMENFFQSKFRAGYHCLLMIDEAQNLPNESLEELRMLSNFYLGKHALLQIFLLGQQQFREILYSDRMEQLRQRVVAATHLEPLSAIDTRDYIRHRLHIVGWNETNPTITKRAFAHVYAITKGIPRRINTFCDRLLLYCSLEDIRDIDDTIVQTVARELAGETSSRDMNAPAVKRVTGEQQSRMEQAEELESISALEKELESADASSPDVAIPEKVAAPLEQNVSTSTLHQGNPFSNFSSNDNTHSEIDDTSSSVSYSVEATPDELFELLEQVRVYSESESINDVDQQLPKNIVTLFRFALGQTETSSADIAKRMGNTSFDELKEATRLFIKELLLNSGADYYRRLGLSSDAEVTLIKEHYRYMFRLFQPDQEIDASLWDESYTRRINQAYSTLRDEGKRKAYDSFLQALQSRKAVETEAVETPFSSVIIASESEEPSGEERDNLTLADKKNGAGSKSVLVYAMVFVAVFVLLVGGWLYYEKPEVFARFGITGIANQEVILPEEPNTRVISAEPDTAAVKEVVDMPETAVEQNVVKVSPVAPAPEHEAEPPALVEIKTLSEEEAAVDDDVLPEPPPVKKNTKPSVKKEPVEKIVVPEEVINKPELIAVKPIKETELKALIGDFSGYYEEANLKAFMALFSNTAITNDRNSKKQIQQDYKDLFEGTDMRVISFENMKWIISENSANGKGDFVVTVLQKGGKKMQKISGVMELEATRERGKLLLTKVLHSYTNQ